MIAGAKTTRTVYRGEYSINFYKQEDYVNCNIAIMAKWNAGIIHQFLDYFDFNKYKRVFAVNDVRGMDMVPSAIEATVRRLNISEEYQTRFRIAVDSYVNGYTSFSF